MYALCVYIMFNITFICVLYDVMMQTTHCLVINQGMEIVTRKLHLFVLLWSPCRSDINIIKYKVRLNAMHIRVLRAKSNISYYK